MNWVRSAGSWDLDIGEYRSRLQRDLSTKKWSLFIAFVPRICYGSDYFEFDVEIAWDFSLTPTLDLVFAKAEEILKQEWPDIFEEEYISY